MRTKNNKAVTHTTDTHRWIVSYADFITLLFAFFVVMYAISSVNISKYKSVAKGVHSAFTKKNSHQDNGKGLGLVEVKDKNKALKDQFKELMDALSELEDSDYQINTNTQDYGKNIRHNRGLVELDIKAGALFASGSAELRPLAIVKLMKLASILNRFPYPIAIEGYTDNQPISTPQFPSNLDLSVARAASVARILIGFRMDQNAVSVTGYGEQYPVADNSTEEGRAQNRRVNLLIAKDKKLMPSLIPEIGKEEGSKTVITNSGGKPIVPPYAAPVN